MPEDETPSASGVLRGRLLLFWAIKEMEDNREISITRMEALFMSKCMRMV